MTQHIDVVIAYWKYLFYSDQPRGLVVRAPVYQPWGLGFDSRLYHVRFSLKGEDAHGDHGLGSW